MRATLLEIGRDYIILARKSALLIGLLLSGKRNKAFKPPNSDLEN
jgi:hypothetical protein